MAPLALTGAGNVTATSSTSATVLTGSKPSGTSDRDLLWALFYHRNIGGTVTAPSGWSVVKIEAGNGTFAFAVKPIPSAATESATSYAFSNNQGNGRCVLLIGRITGADLSDPINAIGATSVFTGTASLVHPSVNAAAGSLLLTVSTNNAGATVASFTAPSGMTQVAQQSVAGSSNAQVAQQLLGSTGATGTRSATMAPAASNSGGFLVAIRAGITDRSVAVARTTETEAVLDIVPVRTVPFGRAAENGSAGLIASGVVIGVGRAAEAARATRFAAPTTAARSSESARAITPLRTVPFGRAAETGSATAPAARKTRSFARAAETDMARAVGPRVALAPETLLNGVPTPLGVRIHNNSTPVLDAWVTRAVDDFTFRSSIPGGFASATITLHRPSIVGSPASGYLFNADKTVFDQLARLFNRVQIVDLRSAEIVWEGRIEGPRRSSDSDTWELSCLGPAVLASDIQRPMFYIDSSIESWLQTPQDYWQFQADETTKVIEVRWGGNLVWPGPAGTGLNLYKALAWQRGQECALKVGRYDITFASSAPAGSANQAPTHLWNSVRVATVTSSQGSDGLFHATNYTQNVRHWRRVNDTLSNFGATGGWQIADVREIQISMGVGNSAGFGDYTSAPDKVVGRIANPHVQVLRLNRNGTELTAPTDYPNDYLTVPQVVEDVIGRFLVGGWNLGVQEFGALGSNLPFPGFVRPIDVYIDTSSTAQFTNLTYFDGATAEQILADMMNAQPGAYWAIWESRYGATDQASDQNLRHRFEWTTWPASWGYLATSLDGLEDQPTGEDLFNYVFYKFPKVEDWNGTPGYKNIRTGYSQRFVAFNEDTQPSFTEGSDLAWGKVPRAITVTRDEPASEAIALDEIAALLSRYRRTGNTGTITIRRPIPFYDPGATSISGASRMVQPWEIRPGRLIKITDVLPRGRIDDFSHGQTAPPEAHDGTVWRIIATEYSSSDNSCRLELDQPAAWSLPTQVTKAAKPAGPTVRKG